MGTDRSTPSRRRLPAIARASLALLVIAGLTLPASAAAGDLDTTFGLASSGVTYTDFSLNRTDQAFAMALQDSGEFVVAGNSNSDIAVARYTSSGALDTAFSGDGRVTTAIAPGPSYAYGVALQADDKVVVGGATSDGVADDFLLLRYTSAGVLDTTFNGSGIVTTTISAGDDVIRDVSIQPADGKIVVAGYSGSQFALARYTTTGALDTTFGGGDGIVLLALFSSQDWGHALALQDDGGILVAGETNNGSNNDFALARFDSTGALDTSFGGGDGWVNTNFGTNTDDFAMAIALQSDNAILLAGYSNSATEDFAVARYTSSGSLDTTFDTDGRVLTPIGSLNDQAHAIAVQSTGKIVVAGFADGAANNNDFALVRYHANGALDTAFSADGIVTTDLGPELGVPSDHTDDQAYALAIQSDNKIVLAGFNDYPPNIGDPNFTLARYESPNTAPTVSAVNKTGLEDTQLSFAAADFTAQFSDPDGDSLVKVVIASLPTGGALTLNGNPVSASQEISAADLGSLRYMPGLNAVGVDSFSWNGFDGLAYAASTALVNIDRAAVNDAPSFTKGANQSANEDGGAQSVTGWATAISAGPADEAGQTLTFTLTTDNDTLFSALPAVSATGTLSYTPAPDANGSALVTISVQDSGGVLNGGVDTSPDQTFSITVNPVNDVPSFTKGGYQSILEDGGAQSVAGWATGISAGPANEAAQSLTFLVSTSNDALFSSLPAVGAAGALSYTPAANANGAAIVTVRLQDNGGTLNGGVDTSASQTFNISVTAVNDAPSFTKGADPAVNEDSGPRSFPAWATNISSGPADESTQSVSFQVSNDNAALFASPPAVTPAGTLTFTPADDIHGSALVTVTLTDNGGVLNGGDDTSTPQSLTITVNPVNDAPSFTKGADQSVNEDSGAQTVAAWATNLSAGPADEAGQSFSFETDTNNDALFSALPAITPDGALTYTPAPDANGAALVTVILHDDGGVLNGGDDTSLPQTFNITVLPVNDAPQVSGFTKDGLRNLDIPFTATDFTAHFTDIDGDALALVKITLLPAHGVLTLNGTPVTAGQEIAATDLAGLAFTPDAFWTGGTGFAWNGSDGGVYAAASADVILNVSVLELQLYLPLVLRS